jgi:hypothetical protein
MLPLLPPLLPLLLLSPPPTEAQTLLLPLLAPLQRWWLLTPLRSLPPAEPLPPLV